MTDELPLDSDLEVDRSPSGRARPVHLRPGHIGVVAVGGTVGTAVREGLSLVVPSVAGIPLAILVINVAGAFALGLLLEVLARRGADEGRRRVLRLLLGTGVLGGFTTYSAFATDVASLAGSGSGAAAAVYAALTLLLGAVASAAGIAVGSALHRSPAGRLGA